MCEVCSRTFSRVSDRERHKCLAERQKPVNEQQSGSALCQQFKRWFHSRGGLAVRQLVFTHPYGQPWPSNGSYSGQDKVGSMYICMYVCMLCMYVCMYACMYVWMDACKCVYII